MYLPGRGFLNPGPITPWAEIGQNLLIKLNQKFALYKVVWLEQLPMSSASVINFGTIAAASTLSAQSLQTPLQADGYELFQMRAKILDDIEMQVYEPQQLPRFVAKNYRSRLSHKAQKLDPYQSLSEMGIFQDQYPYVDVYNNRGYSVVMSRVAFYGFRYRIERLTQDKNPDSPLPPFNTIDDVTPGIPYTAVMAEGFVGTGYERSAL